MMSRICHIELDDANLPPPTPEIEQERKVAMFDLIEENSFTLPKRDDRVVPEGPYRVGLSIRNLALDDGLDDPDAPQGSGPRRVRIRFHTSAYRFKAGNRIRLSVGSSYWPLVWTPPRLGELRILSGRLALPVLNTAPRALSAPFPAPLGMTATNDIQVLSAPVLRRGCERKAHGAVVVDWHQPPVTTLYGDIDTTFSFETSAKHAIRPDDPLSATTAFTHRMEVKRPDGTAQIESHLHVQCTANTYHLATSLQVVWKGQVLARRNWTAAVKRRLA